FVFFFQAEDGIRDDLVTGVQTCALPILGFLVTDLLVESFPDVLNVEFTAGMEDQLDRIEEGEEHYVEALRRFWGPFARDLEQARSEERRVGKGCRAGEGRAERSRKRREA